MSTTSSRRAVRRSSSARRRISSAATNSAITAATTSSLSAMSSALPIPTSRLSCSAAANTCAANRSCKTEAVDARAGQKHCDHRARHHGARDRLAAAGIVMLDCPLSGTGAQAVTRDLALYGSGDEAAYARCRDAFAGFARVSHYLGAFGNGSRMKFVANLLVAVHNAAAAEAIVLGTKAGLDPERILEVIGSGAGNSRIFELRGPMMAKGVYTPPTATMHVLQKDSAIIGEFARALGVATPMLDAAAPLYDEAEAQGYADEDVGAVHAVLARRAGLPTRK